MKIVIYGQTDIGRVRKNNQDSIYTSSRKGLVIVADGIGGRKGGEIASKIAVNGIKSAFNKNESLSDKNVTEFLKETVSSVNQSIINYGSRHPEIAGLATTLNCVVFLAGKAYICHIGDSRTYLYYRSNLWQLSFDHNIENYVERGWLPDEALANQSKAGALVRALGLSEQCDMDIYEINLRPGEIFLTCSDGLSGMVSDSAILNIISANINDLSKIPNLLVKAANKNGGKDNITVAISGVIKD